MIPKLSEEQREAIRTNQGRPVEIEDNQTHSLYLFIARDDFPRMIEEQLRRELQIGFDQVDAGEVDDWNVEEILRAAHTHRSSGNS